MVYPNQETFFIRNRNVMLHSESFQGKEQLVTVEELYQHFKARMMAELELKQSRKWCNIHGSYDAYPNCQGCAGESQLKALRG